MKKWQMIEYLVHLPSEAAFATSSLANLASSMFTPTNFTDGRSRAKASRASSAAGQLVHRVVQKSAVRMHEQYNMCQGGVFCFNRERGGGGGVEVDTRDFKVGCKVTQSEWRILQ